jgi:hypothetical protein
VHPSRTPRSPGAGAAFGPTALDGAHGTPTVTVVRHATPRTTELGAKDARFACELVDAKGMTRLWIGPVARDLYNEAAEAAYRDDDVAFVARMYRSES